MRLVKVKKPRICRVCGRIIGKGERAYAKTFVHGAVYECLGCHRKADGVLVYQPRVKRWGGCKRCNGLSQAGSPQHKI